MSVTIEPTYDGTPCAVRYPIFLWATAGGVLSFLADTMEEKLWVLSMLPWAVWGLAGLILFVWALWSAWRAAWRIPTLLDASLVPALTAVLVLAGPSLAWVGSKLICCAHSSDAVLIENFRVYREEFEQLRTMFQKDQRLGRVAPTFTRSASFFSGALLPEGSDASKARLTHYRKLFRRIGLSAGIEGYDNKDEIWFIASTRGLSITGSAKGYVHMLSNPSPLVADLDSYWSSDGRSFTAYRHLEGHWYLYFDFEN